MVVLHGSKSKLQKTLTNACTLPTNMELELSRESIYGDLRVNFHSEQGL